LISISKIKAKSKKELGYVISFLIKKSIITDRNTGAKFKITYQGANARKGKDKNPKLLGSEEISTERDF
jgi:hypothetical protein